MNTQALKERIRKAADLNKEPFNVIWQRLIIERFLVRLERSPSSQDFVFKGGSLLARYIDINRETKDLDFLLTRIRSEKETIRATLTAIAGVNLKDGFMFNLNSVDDLPHTHMKYPGFTAKISCLFETMEGQIDIDIGFGDVVEPIEKRFGLLTTKDIPIFEDAVSLYAYPPEAILQKNYKPRWYVDL